MPDFQLQLSPFEDNGVITHLKLDVSPSVGKRGP